MVGGASSMADQNYVQDVKGKGYRSERNLHGNLIPEILPLVGEKKRQTKKTHSHCIRWCGHREPTRLLHVSCTGRGIECDQMFRNQRPR